MKISVIIPTYKPQAYIWECLDSLVNQTFAKDEFEIILVLNGCKEPYESEIRSYLAKHFDLCVNFIQINRGGVSNARNVALDVARGEYVTFIDDDDYVSPSFLEELYAKASPNTISLCYPYEFFDGKPLVQLVSGITKTYEKLSGIGRQNFLKSRKYFSGPCMKLIPMSFIHSRRFDTRFANGEDSIFMFLISDKFKYVDYTPKYAIYYRRFRDNSAVTRKRRILDRIRTIFSCLREYTKIYFTGGYDIVFYLIRIAAEIKCIIQTLIR